MSSLVAEFGTGQVLWSMIWFFLFFIWIWLLIVVFSDIFRSDDMNGWVKAIWVLFVVVLPYLGVLVYLIARGGKMKAHNIKAMQDAEAQQRAYIQSVAGSGSGGGAADEIARLADLKDKGVLSEEEFQAGKKKALGG
jgi:hypothetical protein